MATASVTHVQHDDGSHSIGVDIDGTYVPFASVAAARVQHLQDRARTLKPRLDEGDQAAVDANALLPISSSPSKSKDTAKEGGS